MQIQQQIRPYFLILSLIGALALAALVFWPFLKPLALAAIFAVVLQGLYQKISKMLGGWPSVAALATVILSLLLILLPLSLVGALVGNEARDLYVSLEEGSARNTVSELALRVDDVLGEAVPGLGEFLRNISTNIDAYSKDALRWIAGHAGDIFSSVSRFVISFFIFLISLYYLLRDGKHVRRMLIELSPLNDTDDSGVFDKLELAVNSIIRGRFVVALIQGALSTVGFLLFGVQNAFLWGMIAAMAALIPGIGTALVFIPIVIFLFSIGAIPQAIGLLVWGSIIVGLIDNLLGPKLIGRGMNIHPLLVLLSVFGGLIFFGPAGIFFGPLALSLLFALLSIYADISRYS